MDVTCVSQNKFAQKPKNVKIETSENGQGLYNKGTLGQNTGLEYLV
jgi:hypothetical protein